MLKALSSDDPICCAEFDFSGKAHQPLSVVGHPSAFIPHSFRVTLGTHFELTIRSVSHRKSA